jgi:hypothetical protein
MTTPNDEPGTPGLPGYQAEPPPGLSHTYPTPPPAPKQGPLVGAAIGLMPLIFGIIGATVFNVFGIVAIVLGIVTFRSAPPLGRVFSAIGVAAGVVGVVLSAIAFSRTHDLLDLIF